jgi:hypothetical protein
MTLAQVTQRLADVIGMDLPKGLTEQEAAAGIMIAAAQIIRYQQQSIARTRSAPPRRSATPEIVVDLDPVPYQYN